MPIPNVLVANLAQATLGYSFVIPTVPSVSPFTACLFQLLRRTTLYLIHQHLRLRQTRLPQDQHAVAGLNVVTLQPTLVRSRQGRQHRLLRPRNVKRRFLNLPSHRKFSIRKLLRNLMPKQRISWKTSLVVFGAILNKKIWFALARQSLSTNRESTQIVLYLRALDWRNYKPTRRTSIPS